MPHEVSIHRAAPPIIVDDNNVEIRLKPRFLSGKISVAEDTSGNSLWTAFRWLTKVKKLDGPDDLVAGVQLALPAVGQPFVEMGVLALFFPLVAVAAYEAVKSAILEYFSEYPAVVEAALRAQGEFIGVLRRSGVPDVALANLERLHNDGTSRFKHRQEVRQKGIRCLIRHNISTRHLRSSTDLASAFGKAADVVMDRYRGLIEHPDACEFRSSQVHQLSRSMRGAKGSRFPAGLTAGAMSGMAGSMVPAFGSSVVAAVGNTIGGVGLTVSAALQTAAFGILLPSQLTQATGCLMTLYARRKVGKQIQGDGDAFQAVSALTDASACRQHAQMTAWLRRQNRLGQFFEVSLALSQVGMAGSVCASLAGAPSLVTALFAVVFAGTTIVSAIGGDINDKKTGRFMGEATPETIRSLLQPTDTGHLLEWTDNMVWVIGRTAQAYTESQKQLARLELFHHICALQAKHDKHPTGWHEAGHSRMVALRKLAEKKRKRWLPGDRELVGHFRDDIYGPALRLWSASQLADHMSQVISAHPAAQAIDKTEQFRKQLVSTTVKQLLNSHDLSVKALFSNGRGGSVKSVTYDGILQCARCHVKVRHELCKTYNLLMVGKLLDAQRFVRAQYYGALTTLAHTSEQIRANALRLAQTSRTAQLAPESDTGPLRLSGGDGWQTRVRWPDVPCARSVESGLPKVLMPAPRRVFPGQRAGAEPGKYGGRVCPAVSARAPVVVPSLVWH